jgi:hypothetical protein
MKVPRPFLIAGVSDMASPRVRDGSAGFVLANPGQPPRTGGTGASSPTHGLAPITPGGCASPGGPSRAKLALQKSEGTLEPDGEAEPPTVGHKTDNDGITR